MRTPYMPTSAYRNAPFRFADVKTVDLEAQVATVEDSFGAVFDVTLTLVSGRMPKSGESWLLDRSTGYFRFVAPLNAGIPLPGKYAETIGDGVETEFTVVHGLGTKDVAVDVYDLDYGSSVSLLEVARTDDNTVVVTFLVAPDEDSCRVVVVG